MSQERQQVTLTYGEAVELLREYPTYPPMSSRLFLAVDDDRVERFLAEGFKVVRG